jgi:hypothetical protein
VRRPGRVGIGLGQPAVPAGNAPVLTLGEPGQPGGRRRPRLLTGRRRGSQLALQRADRHSPRLVLGHDPVPRPPVKSGVSRRARQPR